MNASGQKSATSLNLFISTPPGGTSASASFSSFSSRSITGSGYVGVCAPASSVAWYLMKAALSSRWNSFIFAPALGPRQRFHISSMAASTSKSGFHWLRQPTYAE